MFGAENFAPVPNIANVFDVIAIRRVSVRVELADCYAKGLGFESPCVRYFSFRCRFVGGRG